MFQAFIQVLSRKLIQNGFIGVENSTGSTMINADTDMIVFQKQFGQSQCLLRIVNLEKTQPLDFETMSNEYAAYLESKIDNFDIPKIYLIYLTVFNNDSPDIQKLIAQGEEFFDQRVYVIHWQVQLGETELTFRCNPNQPTEILNIHQLINESSALFYHDSELGLADESISLQELTEEAIATSPFYKRQQSPLLVYLFIALNGLMFLLLLMNGGTMDIDTLIRFGALVPQRVVANGEYYRMITVLFLHSGLMHFLSNSLGLYIFGSRVEAYYGRIWFFVLYFVSGFGGSLLSMVFSDRVSVGASGAIYGLVGASVAMSLVFRRALDGLSSYILVLYIVMGISVGFLNPQIGNFAHLGGLITGFLMGFIICNWRLHTGRADGSSE